MKPEKVDFYLNKRKEREAESQKPSEDGAEAAEAEQAPNRSDNIQKVKLKRWRWLTNGCFSVRMQQRWNIETLSFPNFPLKQFITLQIMISSCFRSPASEEKTRRRGRRSRDSRDARPR